MSSLQSVYDNIRYTLILSQIFELRCAVGQSSRQIAKLRSFGLEKIIQLIAKKTIELFLTANSRRHSSNDLCLRVSETAAPEGAYRYTMHLA